MRFRPSDHDPNVAQILAGEYRQDSRYSTFREKGSRSYLLIYTRDGGGAVEHTQGTFTVSPGEVLLFAPRHLHGYRTDKNVGLWDLQWAHFHPRPDWDALIRWPERGRGVSVLAPPTAIQQLISSHLTDVRAWYHGDVTERRLALNRFEEILLRLHHFVGAGRIQDERIAQLQGRLRQEFHREWTVDRMAEVAGLSASRFGHLFRDEIGMSPREYLETVRLEEAKRLLAESALAISAISREIGFADEFYFSNRFRRAVGVSPRDYRRSFMA
jgi:AraC family transcriptional regulator of arabinose operon